MHVIQQFDKRPDDICIINDRESLSKDLMKYVNEKHSMEACRYCYGTDHERKVSPAQQLVDIL